VALRKIANIAAMVLIAVAIAQLLARRTHSTSADQLPQDWQPNALQTTVRIYDVRDLYQKMVEFSCGTVNRRTLGPQQIDGNTIDYSAAPIAAQSRQFIEAGEIVWLTIIISDTITPELWVENGGNVASIKGSGGVSIIAHNAEGHRQIESLLATLRRSDAMKWEQDTAGLSKK
jgi:hypothetical protein